MATADRTPLVIGVGFQIGAGKDTIGKYLVEHCAFTRIAFAEPLKDAAAAIYGFDRSRLDDASYKAEVDPFWGETRRRILQVLGTECMRHGHRDDVWVKAAHRRVAQHLSRGESVVITDVRFRNEVEAVKSWGGEVWRVIRPQPKVGDAASLHASESELSGYDGWDAVIFNDSTIADLHLKVERELSK